MNIRSAKAKGRRLAIQVQTSLMETFGLSSNDVRVTPASVPGADLMLSDAAMDKFPFAIECKNTERLNVWQALEQAENHTVKQDHLTPLLVFSRNRSDIYVCLKLEDFLHWGTK
jgi:hypothetical protein